MRVIALNVETTGLSPTGGDRIVEMAAVEIVGRKICTGEHHHFHSYINPGRDIPQEVVRIHGIDSTKIADKPAFRDVADDFLQFISEATLVVHNAPFDLGFISNELSLNGLPSIDHMSVIDTFVLARRKHPHQRNNLTALRSRYGINGGDYGLRGGLIAAEMLANIYLALTGG